MTQVWMLRNSDTNIHIFNREAHLRPSISISYHRCKELNISEERLSNGDIKFTVTGLRHKAEAEEGERFEDVLIFKRYPVWTEPSHL